MKTQQDNIKVLFFLNILRKGAGMINREVAFAEELNNAGYKVSVLSYFKPEMKLHDNITVNSVYPTAYIEKLYSHPLGHFWAFFKIFLLLLIERPKIVLVDLPNEAKWAVLFRKLFRYKIIFNYHGVANPGFYHGATALKLMQIREDGHRMLKKADLVLVVSDFLLQELSQIGVKAYRLYNGIKESQFFVDKTIKKDPNKIVFIGRFTEYKGALTAVKSFSLIAGEFPQLTLDLYGYFESEEYINRIHNFLATKNLTHRVQIKGPIDQEQMRLSISQACLFINASTDETFCMPLLEAQACGTPCVAFQAGGIPEVLADGQTGLLAEPDNIKDMAEKIKRLVSDTSFYNLCQFNTKAHTDRFKYSKLVEELSQHIQKLNWVREGLR